ncbi:MAG: winged helix-turn-helix transcriptional regulator [Lachnospiraceae bacterium]|nr:winged helix-turn-helix transcriptional regulator [Lachnospiraceae bacterium]MBR4085828.1 winged helix-turn-helix transcriptional regulator [Lachnospiraceae bacterium]
MDLIKQFREYSRLLNYHFGNIDNADCCCGEINKSQCFMIVEIGRKPGISVKELAEIMRVDKSGISRLVEDLVQKEYVERKPAVTDRRFVTLNLLPKGQERFEKIEHDMYDRFERILEQIPVDKRMQVIESLKIYNEACRIMEDKNDE